MNALRVPGSGRRLAQGQTPRHSLLLAPWLPGVEYDAPDDRSGGGQTTSLSASIRVICGKPVSPPGHQPGSRLLQRSPLGDVSAKRRMRVFPRQLCSRGARRGCSSESLIRPFGPSSPRGERDSQSANSRFSSWSSAAMILSTQPWKRCAPVSLRPKVTLSIAPAFSAFCRPKPVM